MYETLVRPIEVFQIPPLQPISVVSEKLKRSELKREDKRLRQIAANKAKRKRDAVEDTYVDGSLNATGLADGAGQTGGTSKRVKMEEDDSFPMTEEDDDGVPPMKEGQDINMNMEITTVGGPSTSAFPLVKAMDPPTTTFSMPTSDVVADIPMSTATTPPVKINVSKALPEVRGHTSYLTFACLIPIPGSAKASAVPPEVPTDKTTSESIYA